MGGDGHFCATVLLQAYKKFKVKVNIIELVCLYEIYTPKPLYKKVCLFVLVLLLWPSQPNGVMSSSVSSHNHSFTGQA